MVLVVKNPLANAGGMRDAGSIPGSGRSPAVGNGKPTPGAWWATVHGVAKSQILLKRLSARTHTHTHTHTCMSHQGSPFHGLNINKV